MRHEVWTTKDGQQIPITEMTTVHLGNTIVFLENKRQGECEGFSIDELPYHDEALEEMLLVMREEYSRRENHGE